MTSIRTTSTDSITTDIFPEWFSKNKLDTHLYNGGAKRKAQEFEIPFLGEIPINIQLRVNGDEGNTGANFEVAEVAAPLEQMCKQLVRELASKHQDEPPLPSLSVL